MNRRGFLRFLAGAIATATLDPDLQLFVPGKRLISIPRVVSPTLDEINKITLKYIYLPVADVVFVRSPLYTISHDGIRRYVGGSNDGEPVGELISHRWEA